MKFTILKEDLCKALKKVIGGIGVGGSKDTDYLKITASSEGVEFMTTGSLVGIKTRIDGYVTVVEEGECCTSCKKALDMALDTIKNQLSDELMKFIAENFGDVERWLIGKIESSLYDLKNK